MHKVLASHFADQHPTVATVIGLGVVLAVVIGGIWLYNKIKG